MLGIYPGSFDPITFGHIEIMRRAIKFVDVLYVAVANNTAKNAIFSIEQRLRLIELSLAEQGLSNQQIKLHAFDGLLVNFAKTVKANLIIRGLRAVSDFEYEFQMSCINTKLWPELQTIFIPASDHTQYISSRFIKEVAKLKGDVSPFVGEEVQKALAAYYV